MKNSWNREPHSLLNRECAAYFSQPVFDRMLKGFREKYISYGRFSGKVVLHRLSVEDIDALEGFFQKGFHGQKSVTISAERFEKALQDSRFGAITPKQLLELYFQDEMTGKRELQEREESRWKQLYEEMTRDYGDTPARQLLEELAQPKQQETDAVRQHVMKCYKESGSDMREAKKVLLLAAEIVNSFPYRRASREYLAVFAAMTTGNPHAFDEGTREGQLLQLLVKWDTKNRQLALEGSDIFPALQKQKLYYAVGILRDDISNYAMLSGIQAWKEDGSVHEGMEGFWKEKAAVQVPLAVIAGWSRIACPGQSVYIVENPSIYAMLCRKWQGQRACMCMNGQPRLSALLLLDLLARAGVRVYYAGDFDPEGLLIAQKLRQYYKGDFSYWHMSEQIYQKSLSGEGISEKRLRILERITDPELQDTVHAVARSKKAGYQENVWQIYLET